MTHVICIFARTRRAPIAATTTARSQHLALIQ